MIQLGQRSAAALRYLWKFSALADHVHAGDALDTDRNTLDPMPLIDDEWRYSSGEAALIDVAMCIANGHSADLSRLTVLDDTNRVAVAEAIRLWLCDDTSEALS